RLSGGALCFPTGWALTEKLGHPLEFIHGVVPGLNAALASPIDQFLSRMKPGGAFLRDNWGISATEALNQHPAMRLPAPDAPVALDRLWLRVEHQALVALPLSRGIIFGIRISNHRLDQLREDAELSSGLARALSTMPAPMAAYKRLSDIRHELVAALT
ncbi:MAG: heme-dependent oxidative N-demethylase subunit alpha family protein, partial [Opitutus sp.]